MKPKDQIKTIAELDGWNKESEPCPANEVWGTSGNKPRWNFIHQLPPYLTSRDAIVPVIEKQSTNIRLEIGIQLAIMRRELHGYPTDNNVEGWIIVALIATPFQLCEALLRATNKWKD